MPVIIGRDILSIPIECYFRLAGVGRYPIDGVVEPSIEVTGRVVFARCEGVALDAIKILGSVFIDRKQFVGLFS